MDSLPLKGLGERERELSIFSLLAWSAVEHRVCETVTSIRTNKHLGPDQKHCLTHLILTLAKRRWDTTHKTHSGEWKPSRCKFSPPFLVAFPLTPCSLLKFGVSCLLLTEDLGDSSEIKRLQTQIKFRKIFRKVNFGADVWISAKLKVALDVWVNSKVARDFF